MDSFGNCREFKKLSRNTAKRTPCARHGWNGDVAERNLNLATRWSLVASLTPQPPYIW